MARTIMYHQLKNYMFLPTFKKNSLGVAIQNKFRNICLSDTKNRSNQPSELQVKLTSMKRGIWTGVQTDEKGPLSWGISSFAMNSYFTDSEALLRSCSKKLEELEGEQKKTKDEKKMKKSKSKKQLSLKMPNSVDDILEPITKLPKPWKKKGRTKQNKSDSSQYMNNTSFTDIPRNTQNSKASPTSNRQAKTRFRKGAFVTTAIQNKKTGSKANISENSDSDDSIKSTKKVEKKSKVKIKISKAMSESKLKD